MMKRKRGAGGSFAGEAAFLFLLFVGGGPLLAQENVSTSRGPHRGTIGVFLGTTSSRQLWNEPVASDRLRGIAGGVFVDVQTPLPLVSVRVEAGYAGRGSIVWDEDQDPLRRSEATVRSHYLSIPIHGRVEVGFGPLFGYLCAGPTVDFLLASECSREFCQSVREEKAAVLNAGAGGGVGVKVPGGLRVSLDLRHIEGLSESYLGNLSSARNRTVEILVRLGRPR